MPKAKRIAPAAVVAIVYIVGVLVAGPVGASLALAAIIGSFLFAGSLLQKKKQAMSAGADQIIMQRISAIVYLVKPVLPLLLSIIALAAGFLFEGANLQGGPSAHALSIAGLLGTAFFALLFWRGHAHSKALPGGPIESDEIGAVLSFKAGSIAAPEEVQSAPVSAPEEIVASHGLDAAQARPLEDVLYDLDQMLGLQKVKELVRSEIAYVQAEQLKQSQNPEYQPQPLRRHSLYAGPPGTGKTTIARLHSAALQSLGIVNGVYRQTTASELISPNIGRSGEQTRELLHSCAGGMVFVDEVQGFLGRAGEGADLGREALQTFLNEMENNPDCPLVVFASYPEKIEEVLQHDPGLRSRFRVRIEFEPYGPEELTQIAIKQARDEQHYFSAEAEEALSRTIAALHNRFASSPAWSSGRVAATLYSNIKRAQSENLTGDDPFELRTEDVRKGLELYLQSNPFGAQ